MAAAGRRAAGATIPFGCSARAAFVTLEKDLFTGVARSLARHGFRTIYLVPSHGGNSRR